MTSVPRYVLVTPARNEARFIELTLRSVIAQSVKPVKWVVVSDGSTDGTDEIVARYATDHPWIEQIRMPERRERHFAGKAHALNAGSARLKDVEYEAVGCLDADVSFDEGYFRFLLEKLVQNPSLGLVGTAHQGGSMYNYRFVSIEHVSGACQLFRRECFEAIGGYVPMPLGGVDHLAALTARMKGWETRTFTEKVALHHRETGSATHGRLMTKFRTGTVDYLLGSHPLWECCRTVYQMTNKPYLVGGLTLLTGYLSASLRRAKRPVSAELLAFRRREQMQRLKEFVLRSPRSTANQDR